MTTTTVDSAIDPGKERLVFDWNKMRSHPAFNPLALALAGIILCFWPLLQGLPKLWFDKQNEYFSHGPLIPFMVIAIIWNWWPKLRNIPVKKFWPAILFMIPGLWLFRTGVATDIDLATSISFVYVTLCAVWLLLGMRWMWSLFIPIGFTLFMLPSFPQSMIDRFTNPLQLMSANIAYKMLEWTGFGPERDAVDNTVIYVKAFVLNVGVACSGLKTVIAVTAFTVFFVCIARLNFWGNLIMFILMLPICLFINGLRIALIGVVGGLMGSDAGMKFHDYSGYLSIVICFIIILSFAKVLGWKD